MQLWNAVARSHTVAWYLLVAMGPNERRSEHALAGHPRAHSMCSMGPAMHHVSRKFVPAMRPPKGCADSPRSGAHDHGLSRPRRARRARRWRETVLQVIHADFKVVRSP